MACIEDFIPTLCITPQKQEAANDAFERGKPQHRVVWDFLRQGYTITQAEATVYWIYTRLADVVYQIKQKSYYHQSDYIIDSEDVESQRGSTYAKYFLVPERDQRDLLKDRDLSA